MLASAPSVWLAAWYYFGRLREDGFRKHDVLLQSNDNFGRDFLGTLVFHQRQGAAKNYGTGRDLQILIYVSGNNECPEPTEPRDCCHFPTA